MSLLGQENKCIPEPVEQPESMTDLLIIIPAYNEAKNIPAVLDQFERLGISKIADILVMDDASSDETGQLAKERGHAVVTHVYNLGYGSGLQLGYKYAVRKNYEYVNQMNADGQHDACNVTELYKRLKTPDQEGVYPDIVLGSRLLEGSTLFPVGPVKRFAFALFRLLIHLGTGRRIMDPTTGLQGLSKRTFRSETGILHVSHDVFHDRGVDSGQGIQSGCGGNRFSNVRFRHRIAALIQKMFYECLGNP